MIKNYLVKIEDVQKSELESGKRDRLSLFLENACFLIAKEQVFVYDIVLIHLRKKVRVWHY